MTAQHSTAHHITAELLSGDSTTTPLSSIQYSLSFVPSPFQKLRAKQAELAAERARLEANRLEHQARQRQVQQQQELEAAERRRKLEQQQYDEGLLLVFAFVLLSDCHKMCELRYFVEVTFNDDHVRVVLERR